jgi:hypothetical protein
LAEHLLLTQNFYLWCTFGEKLLKID